MHNQILKRIITIIFLFIITVQTAGLYHKSGRSQYSCMQDIEEKLENGSKEFKKEGEVFVSCIMPALLALSNRSVFKPSRVIITSAPVIDHLAPPPDRNSLFC